MREADKAPSREVLTSRAGMEMVRVDLYPDSLDYWTYLVNRPNNQDNFVPFEGRGIQIPATQTVGAIGDIRLEVTSRKILSVTRFFPFSAYVDQKYPWLLKKGVAADLEEIMAADLLNLLGTDYRIQYINPSQRATEHLHKFGMKGNEAYPLLDFFTAIVRR